jgi:formyl-CoA transferase
MSEALPLAGLVVLDISTFIAAPAAATALADYGADVIKIEAPGEGDPHRHNYKRAATYPRSDSNFPLQLDGRLKRSLALDLKKKEARPVLEALISRRDDREFSAAGARATEIALGGHRADQSAPGLLLAHRLRRDGTR